MRIPKVGDWIKLAKWCGDYYDVKRVDQTHVWLGGGTYGPFSYALTEPWLFRDPETPKLDLTKPLQTMAGTPVRLLCSDAPGSFPVVVLFPCGKVGKRYADGTHDAYEGAHLVNVPEKPPEPVVLTREILLYRTIKGKIMMVVDGENPQNSEADAPWRKRILGKATVTITEGEGIIASDGGSIAE